MACRPGQRQLRLRQGRLLPPGAARLRHLRQQGAGGRPRARQLQGHPRRRVHRGLDAVEYATEPWCWGGNSSCGVNDGYEEFTKKHDVDENTKNYDAGKDFTDAASMFNLVGLARPS
ncbi:hypothetical protein [Streptomyces mirabilis]|uniref:hypothetical protein n=1 Tax=Streptomyces mirabilis TaxID=68239 RepID=UPI00331B809C